MKIIAISNQKGGVGKTTTSVNLSAALATRGKRVLLADIDPQGNTTSALATETGGRSLYHALIGDCPVSELVQPTRIAGLSLIPADLDMAGAEIEVARMEAHLSQLRRALEPLHPQGAFDFLLLDCPPSLGIWMSNALAAAHEVLVPVQCEYYSLEGLSLLMRVIDEIRSTGANRDLSLCGLVLTMVDARTRLNAAVVEDVRNHMGDVVFATHIPRSIRFGEAPSHRRTIFEHDPHGAGSQAYHELASEFLDRQARGVSFIPPPAAAAAP